MSDQLMADPEGLESMGRELRGAAEELRTHAARFQEQCGRSGDAYGNLPESRDTAKQHSAGVAQMNDHLDQHISSLHSQSDFLSNLARTYRGAQSSALEAISRQASPSGA